MKARLLSSALVTLALLAVAAPSASAATAKKPSPVYYLALGDSLSVGFQPNQNGVGRETNLGYANDLAHTEARHVKHLQLVEMGCPGATTGSMLNGKGNAASAKAFHCDQAGGSQLTAAERFLRAHHKKGEVALITVDIGANDVDGCASQTTLAGVATCVTAGENSIKTNTPKILDGLRAAAPKGTTMVAMNLYDPVLAEYFSTNPNDKTLADASVSLLKSINGDIQSADTAAGFKTADVADAFDSYDQTTMVSWESQEIPIDVARICAWTWACTTPPVGPNIHANDNGYTVIADTFATTIGKLS
jgi:lysophospholipase L1-like esterase